MHQNCYHFWLRLCPETRWESYNAPPDLLVDWRGSYPLPIPLPHQCIPRLDVWSSFLNMIKYDCLQCFDVVGWSAGRASGL